MEERDAPVDVTTVIRTDYKTDVVIDVKTQDILDTIYRTDVVYDTRQIVHTDIRTDVVYQTHVANIPEAPRPSAAVVHSIAAPAIQCPQTHAQPVQPAQTHVQEAPKPVSKAHPVEPATNVQAPAQTHAQASVETHIQPVRTQVQAPVETHVQSV
jgi:hypothetical protein